MAVVRVKMGNQVVGKWVQLAGGGKQQLGDLASLNVHCNASKCNALHYCCNKQCKSVATVLLLLAIPTHWTLNISAIKSFFEILQSATHHSIIASQFGVHWVLASIPKHVSNAFIGLIEIPPKLLPIALNMTKMTLQGPFPMWDRWRLFNKWLFFCNFHWKQSDPSFLPKCWIDTHQKLFFDCPSSTFAFAVDSIKYDLSTSLILQSLSKQKVLLNQHGALSCCLFVIMNIWLFQNLFELLHLGFVLCYKWDLLDLMHLGLSSAITFHVESANTLFFQPLPRIWWWWDAVARCSSNHNQI